MQNTTTRWQTQPNHVPGHRARLGGVLLSCALLAACATTTQPVAEATPAPQQVSLQELIQQGEAAQQQGHREQSRSRYREAASAYPTSKPPWQKLAEGYFEAGEYGNAILAAQEVLQRDPQDRMAHSILAVAGLRVSASSLTALRDPRTDLPASSREEAVLLTQTLRETLGEKTLVLPASEAASAAAPAPTSLFPPDPPRAAAPRRPRVATAPSPAPALAPAAPAAARQAPPASGNPFDKLK